MRIVIASGIYPPDIGGPALYARNVKGALEGMGHVAPLVLFGPFRNYPAGIRHFLYAMKLFRVAFGADAIFAFDTFSVGIPAAIVGSFLGKKVVLRVGGDVMWENYVERTKQLMPITEFYGKRPALTARERITRSFVRWMLRHCELAFNSRWLLDLWKDAYHFHVSRSHVVGNVVETRLPNAGSDRTVLLYGRQILLKNTEAFRRAFAASGTNLVLEEGVLPHEQFLDRLARAHAVAVPSISDVAPNTIIDSIRCGKPFLLTKYSGYAEEFGDFGITVDPLDEADMARGVRQLADPVLYETLSIKIAGFRDTRTYADVAREMLACLNV